MDKPEVQYEIIANHVYPFPFLIERDGVPVGSCLTERMAWAALKTMMEEDDPSLLEDEGWDERFWGKEKP